MAEQMRNRSAPPPPKGSMATAGADASASLGVPDFSKETEVYDDACDFGQFMLNPCLYIFDSTMRCARRISLKSTLGHIQRCDKLASAHVQQFIYCLAVFGSWTIVFIKVYPLCWQSNHLANYHTYLGCCVFAICVGSWRFACGIDPGNITDEQTLAKYDVYPYDDFLYTNKICPTLKIRKLARSKYDKYSDRHVPRFDHFCGWLNQPIGEENYRWFLFFLLIHVGMCVYGSTVLYLLLRGEIEDELGFFQTKLVMVAWKHIWVVVAFLLMVIMCFVLGAFFAFHLWLTAKNMTTNEHYKWREIKAWHQQATSKYQQALRSGAIRPDGGKTMASGMTYYQIRSKSTERDEERNGGEIVNDGIIINPGPMRSNAYDHGVVRNFGEVIFPLALRKEERRKNL